jgi:hypothetical protein
MGKDRAAASKSLIRGPSLICHESWLRLTTKVTSYYPPPASCSAASESSSGLIAPYHAIRASNFARTLKPLALGGGERGTSYYPFKPAENQNC